MGSQGVIGGTMTFGEPAWPDALRTEGLCAILSKWFLQTRLETRTKESKTNASMVVEKPTCEMKVSDAILTGQHRPAMSHW